MRDTVRTIWLGVVLALVTIACAAVVVGCGGGASSGGTSSSVSNGTESSEPSAEFAGKGKNGELAAAGKESSVEEREAASRVLEENMTARAAGDWEGQCETLTPGLVEQLEKGGSAVVEPDCASRLEAMSKKALRGTLENTMTEPLAALRVNGNLAFAFYHGAGGQDYVVPMEKRGGEWKVATLLPQGAP